MSYDLYPFFVIGLLVAGWAAQRAGLFRKRPPLYTGIKVAGAPDGAFDYTKASERFASQAQTVLSEGLKKVGWPLSFSALAVCTDSLNSMPASSKSSPEQARESSCRRSISTKSRVTIS
jgi:hypothetical protein